MKSLLFICLVSLMAVTGLAYTKNDLKGDVPITYIGIDFSKLKFLGAATQFGDAGDITNSALVTKYFPAWNNLFITEKDKYDVGKAMGKDVPYELNLTIKTNEKLANKNFFYSESESFEHLSIDDINTIAKSYKNSKANGVVMFFVAETFSKARESAAVWVVYADAAKGDVVLAERLVVKPGGIGFRNYWAKTFAHALKDIKSNFKKWTK
jgi:hypothetical protein